jgi:methyl-accepting chemotaxis protein
MRGLGFAIPQGVWNVSSRQLKPVLPRFIARSLRWKMTLWIVLTLAIAFSGYVALEIRTQQQRQRTELDQKGRAAATVGARMAASALEEAIKSGLLTREQVFDTNHVPVANSNPPKFTVGYGAYTQRVLDPVTKQVKSDPDVTISAVFSRTGLAAAFSDAARTGIVTGDLSVMKKVESTNDIVMQEVILTTGDTVWDYAAPITVDGKHWGTFRLGYSMTRIQAALWETTFRLAGTAVALLTILGVLTWIIVGRLTGPLAQVTNAARALAEGNIDCTVTHRSQDELGQMADAFRDMIGHQHEMAGIAVAIADGDLTHDVEPASDKDVLGSAFRRMLGGLRDLVGQLQASALGVSGVSGHLTGAASHTAQSVEQVNFAVQRLAGGGRQQADIAEGAAGAVAALAEAASQVTRGAQDQAQSIGTIADTTREMADRVSEVAASARDALTASRQTKDSAEQGARAVRRTVTGMHEITTVVGEAANEVAELGKLGEKIGAVVETIDDIAEQTNLLALNAAIEAARAGEHGRGFAVVADEVRKLAERSQRETKAISELIRQVQTGTQQAVNAMRRGEEQIQGGVDQADQAGSALDAILSAVDGTLSLVERISEAAEVVAGQSRDVSEATVQISAVVEQSSAAAEEMTGTAGEVSHAVTSVSTLAAENSGASEEVSAAAAEMSEQVRELTEQADGLAAAADELRALAVRFHVDAEAADDAYAAYEEPVRPAPRSRRVHAA